MHGKLTIFVVHSILACSGTLVAKGLQMEPCTDRNERTTPFIFHGQNGKRYSLQARTFYEHQFYVRRNATWWPYSRDRLT